MFFFVLEDMRYAYLLNLLGIKDGDLETVLDINKENFKELCQW
jgi:hypothetical protein